MIQPASTGATSRARLKLSAVTATTCCTISRDTSRGPSDMRTGWCAEDVMPMASAATATPQDPTTGSAMARTASMPAMAAFVANAARRMSTRSAITPKNGPAKSVGARLSAATNPTNPAEPVRSHASQDKVTLWTQIACTAKKTPTKNREN
jgi:hypothetical protein